MSFAALFAFLSSCLAAAAVVELAAAPAVVRRRGKLLGSLMRVGRRLGAPAPPRDLGERLDAAGTPLGLRPGDVMAAKGGAALVAPLVALPLAAALPGRLPLTVALVAGAAGWLGPDLWLRRRATRRAATMAAEVPDVLDLLRVAVEAGLPPGRALSEVARHHGGLLATELGRAARQTELGVPRSHALKTLRRRAPLPAVAALATAIERADRHGAPLGPSLEALAQDARAERARRAREAAARAAPKIQLAVAGLLVPGAMLLVASALLGALR